MAVRRNILTDTVSRQKFVRAAIALKAQFTGVTTTSLGIAGPSRPVSTWTTASGVVAGFGQFAAQPFDLGLDRVVLRHLSPEEGVGHVELFLESLRRQVVCV